MSKFLSCFVFLFVLFFNINLLADTKDDIAQINELKEAGLLSELDYKNLLDKSIAKTKEYIQIKSLLDSEIINLQEFDNFIDKIIIKYTAAAKYDAAKKANFFDNKEKYYE